MLYIHFNNKVPNEKKFEYAVQGNNKVDVITFDISNIAELDFEPAHTYVKVQTKDQKYVDKIELTNNGGGILTWNLLAKTTRHRLIECQLSFETIDKCYQTEMFELTLKANIDADGEIENDYPTILQDLQKQIDELGGGGASSVEIKRVYLTYDDRKSIRSDFLGYDEGTPFINDSTRIWYNFETTPISSKMEQEIKNGRFVIRLDYPLKNRSKISLSSESRYPHIFRTPTKKQGVGTRGYLYSFDEEYYGKGLKYRNILLRSLIFVNESDIKVNSYGEKYIHKKVSLFDYINRTCEFNNLALSPITNEWLENDPQGTGFFNSYLDGRYVLGIPHTFSTGNNVEENGGLYAGTKRMKMYQGIDEFPNANELGRTNSAKLNPAFTCYTPLKLGGTFNAIVLKSPYYICSRSKEYKFYNYNVDFVIMGKEDEPAGKRITKKAYMSARPRCAILNDDYENSKKAFIKTYPQSDQQIRLFCKVVRDIFEYGVEYMPIFRTLITQK